MVEDNYMAEWFEASLGEPHAGPEPVKQDFSTLEEYYVARLIWQTEMLLGKLYTTDSIVKGDSDRGILEHNFTWIVREAMYG